MIDHGLQAKSATMSPADRSRVIWVRTPGGTVGRVLEVQRHGRVSRLLETVGGGRVWVHGRVSVIEDPRPVHAFIPSNPDNWAFNCARCGMPAKDHENQ